MLEEMTGRAPAEAGAGGEARAPRHCLLEARALTTGALPQPIDLRCHGGEIVGIAGLAGAGKTELLRAIFGLDRRTGGALVRHLDDGSVMVDNASQAVRAGAGLVAEDRQSMGLFPQLSVLGNVMTPGATGIGSSLRRTGGSAERRATEELIARLDIRCTGTGQAVTELSGGNQQKTLIARWLRLGVEVLLLDEPTRGVDVATKRAIYELLRELRRQGKAIVVASSENEELMTICDRILVLSNREPAVELRPDAWSEQAILSAAFSGFAAARGGNTDRTLRQ